MQNASHSKKFFLQKFALEVKNIQRNSVTATHFETERSENDTALTRLCDPTRPIDFYISTDIVLYSTNHYVKQYDERERDDILLGLQAINVFIELQKSIFRHFLHSLKLRKQS